MKKKEILIFLIIFAISICSTICFLQPHYSIDTLEFLQNGYKSYINSKFLVDGRVFSAILLGLIIDLPMKYVIPVLYVIGLFISSFIVMYIRRIIIEFGELDKDRINFFPTIISYVILFNFMYLDCFQFMEFPIMSISVLLYIIAAKLIICKGKNYFFKSIICVIIAMFCYQGTYSALIATAFVFSIIKNKKINKDVLKDLVVVGIVFIIGLLSSFIFMLFVNKNNIPNRLDVNYIENIKNSFISLFLIIFNNSKLYPEFLQIAFLLCILIYCLQKKINIKNIISIYFFSIIIIIFIVLLRNEMTFQSGRIYFSIGALIGYLFMYIWCTQKIETKDYYIKILVFLYFITIIAVYSLYTYFYMYGQKIDKNICKDINNIIQKYEKETDKKIKKFDIRRNEFNLDITDTEFFCNYNKSGLIYYTIRAGRPTRGLITESLYSVYTGRKLDRIIFDKIQEHFDKCITTKKIDENRVKCVDDIVLMNFIINKEE